jgi:hypothetical protein
MDGETGRLSGIPPFPGQSRRRILAAGAALAAPASSTRAKTITGMPPWAPGCSQPTQTDRHQRLAFLHAAKGRCGRSFGRPPDPARSANARRQGWRRRCFHRRPARWALRLSIWALHGRAVPKGNAQQGPHEAATPASSIAQYSNRSKHIATASFPARTSPLLVALDQDAVLLGLEHGTIPLQGVDGKRPFELLLQNTMERHGRMQDDWMSRRVLRLSRLRGASGVF